MAESISHTLTFALADLEVRYDTIDNVEYAIVGYDGMTTSGNTAEPALPSTSVTFELPPFAKNVQVNCTKSGSRLLPLRGSVIPVQRPLYYGSYDTSFIHADCVYNLMRYPNTNAEIIGDGYLDGNIRLVTVQVNPIEFLNNIRFLRLYTTINIQLDFEIANEISELPARPLGRSSIQMRTMPPSQQDSIVHIAYNDIIRYPNIGTYIQPPYLPAIQGSFKPKGYEYTVITSAELAPAFSRFIALKRLKGYDIGVVTMESILSNPYFALGDTFSGINDAAGRLRQYLLYIYNHNNAKYVLLGGTGDIVPFRYGLSDHSGLNQSEGTIPTDIYFSDLSTNWGANEPYGLEYRFTDYMPELYVGRLLCNSAEDVKNYTDKVEIYELNPGNGDTGYLNRGFEMYCNQFARFKDYVNPFTSGIADSKLQIFQPEFVESWDNLGKPTGAEVVDSINRFHPAFVLFVGHGNPIRQCVAYPLKYEDGRSTDGMWGSGIDSHDDRLNEPETGNGYDCFTNKYYPFIQYSMSCLTMSYDDYPGYENLDVVGRTALNGKDQGAVAYLGNTRFGYVASFGSQDYYSLVLEKAFFNLIKQGYSLGEAEALSKAEITSIYKLGSSCDHHIKLTHNLLGDPTIHPWLQIPEQLNNVNYSINDTIIYVNCPQGENFEVTEFNIRNEMQNKYKISNGYNSSFTYSVNCMACLQSASVIPVVLPVILSNITLDKQMTVFSSDLFVGSASNPGELPDSPNNVIFGSNSDYYFISKGDVHLDHGTLLQSGASLKIEAAGDVYINQIAVEPNTAIEINCNHCIITNTNFPFGANIVINENN